jgi:uncharacterized membrane protein SpoIIM required for sporulation
MREVSFLKENAETWKKFEQNLDSKNVDPDVLAEQFIRISDDLSYARTYYPGSQTTKYLNSLATKVHLRIYKNKKERSNRFITFWTYDVPTSVWEARKHIRASLIIFIVCVLIGFVSEYYNEDFIRNLLGDEYVNKTLENIKNHDPMGVYGQNGGPFYSFYTIAFHNILVTMQTFVLGIFISIGTLYSIFTNGVMVGLFESLMLKQGYIWTSLGIIMIHGTLELSCIIIAGGAGFYLGAGILFPGTYTRLQSLLKAARNGMIIIMGICPIVFTAAIFEGFVTRHTGMNPIIKLAIIFCTFSFIIYYFGIYPFLLNKKIRYGNNTL